VARAGDVLAVFGGTFDPPHSGHVSMLDAALSVGGVDGVLVVPSARPPHKASAPSASYSDRLAMSRLMSEFFGRGVCVSDIEGRMSTGEVLSYTFDTLEALELEYPGVELRFLIGGDSLAALHTWFKADEIVARWGVLTVPRSDSEGVRSSGLEFVLRENWPLGIASKLVDSILSCEKVDISSSLVRARLEGGEDVSALLPPSVLSYIEKKGLYKCRK